MTINKTAEPIDMVRLLFKRLGGQMAVKQVVISDISGEEVEDAKHVRLQISGHTALEGRTVELDISSDEAAKMTDTELYLVHLDIREPDKPPRQVTMEIDAFEKAFPTKVDVIRLLTDAAPAPAAEPRTRGRRRSAAPSSSAPKVDYASREHAGELHRGRVTDEEKALVKADPAQASKNRERQTGKPIVWDDPKETKRYG